MSHHPAPDTLAGFPDAVPARPRTPVQGGGGLRRRWEIPGGPVLEWDYQHGTVEMYNRRGRHIGECDPNTGKQLTRPIPTRSIER